MQTSAETVLLEIDLVGEWRRDAACRGRIGEVEFFPSRGESAAEAKALCARCPVREECLDYALRWDLLCGVWGGMSERERRQLRRSRRRAANLR